MRNIYAAIGVALVAIYSVGSGIWVNTGDNWYRELNSPSWQPPDWVFGVIWPYNFIVLGWAAIRVAQSATAAVNITYLVIFGLSVICALIWAYQFYRPHNLAAASIALTLTAILTLPVIVIIFRDSIAVGFALMPYQLWVATASALSWSYNRLN
jgi:tryptophan-rich sensory protein